MVLNKTRLTVLDNFLLNPLLDERKIQDLLDRKISALDKTKHPVLDEKKILEVLMKNPALDTQRENFRQNQNSGRLPDEKNSRSDNGKSRTREREREENVSTRQDQNSSTRRKKIFPYGSDNQSLLDERKIPNPRLDTRQERERESPRDVGEREWGQ